MTSTM